MASKRMTWDKLLSSKRYGIKSERSDIRSEYQKDIDRIIFSDPFHRLVRKTQVHPLNENDHIHSRLTHSLEASSVGRSMGEYIGRFLKENDELPQEAQPWHLGQIVQAACLAHDIGNPPFGHSGETAIKNWFKSKPLNIDHLDEKCRSDFTKFDGNAMSLRILLHTGFYREGMSPTHAVVGSLLKYPWPSCFNAGKEKFSYFVTEEKAVHEIAAELGLIKYGSRYSRHPLAYLTEAADDICYRIIDIEDATEMGILDEMFMFNQFSAILGITKDNEDRYDWYMQRHFRQRNSILRAKLIGELVTEIVAVFKDNYDDIMTGNFDYKKSLMEKHSGGACSVVLESYKSIEKKLFLSRRKAILEIGAQNSLGSILSCAMKEAKNFCTDTKSYGKDKIKILLGEDVVEKIQEDKEKCHYLIIMSILDYITGMTDHYATDMCRKFLGLGF